MGYAYLLSNTKYWNVITGRDEVVLVETIEYV